MQKKAFIKKKTTGEKVQNKKEKKLRVLILEDNPADAELMERQLKKDGITFVSQRVENKSNYLKALKTFQPDLILADFTLPKFDAMEALALARKTFPFIPFIVVTGSIGEEKAVACLRLGADDYLLKDRLARLPEAVRHALEKHRLLEAKDDAEAAIKAAAVRWRTTFDSMQDAVCLLDESGAVLQCNRAMNLLLGLPYQKIIGNNCLGLICGKEKRKTCAFTKMMKTRQRMEEETFWRGRWYHTTVDPVIGAAGKMVGAVHIMTDISAPKRAEQQLAASEKNLREMSAIFQLFLKHNPIYVFIKDENIRPIYLSENYEKMLGRPLAEILGKNMDELFPSKLSRSMVEDDKRILREGKSREFIEELNGRTYSTLKFPIIIDGKAKYLAGYTTDITERKRAEEALKKSEQCYAEVAALSRTCTWETDLRGMFTFVNPIVEEIAGFRPDELVGKMHFYDLAPAEDRDTVINAGMTVIQNRQPTSFENRILTKDGRVIWAHTLGMPFFGEQGELIGLRGADTDITERRRAEDKLRDSENFILTTINSLKGHICVLDESGRIVLTNKAWDDFAIANSADPQCVSKGVNYLSVCDSVTGPDLESASSCSKSIRAVLSGDSPEFSMEYPCHSPTEKRWFLGKVSPLQRRDSSWVVINHENITERKQAEEALRESEDKFKYIFDHASVGKSLTLPTGEISVNQAMCDMLGYSLSEFKNKKWQEITHPEDIELTQREMDQLLCGKRDVARFVKRFLHKDGSLVWVSLSSAIRRDADGKPLYLMTTIIDITERVQAERYKNDIVAMNPMSIQVLDKEGFTLEANPAYKALFGSVPPADYSIFNDLQLAQKGVGEIFDQLRNGEVVHFPDVNFSPHDSIPELPDVSAWVRTIGFPISDSNGKPERFILMHENISERKRDEDLIRASLLEKELLLKEIHHRVKNNLQVISGLLTLQAAQIGDERLQRIIKDSQSRIWTMALIHQMLYQSGNLADIDMADYIRTLSGNLLSSQAQVTMLPTIIFNLLPLRLVIDKAIPLALIINELLTNAMKHAFPDGQPGEIQIELQECRDRSRPVPTDNTGTARRAPTKNMDATPREGIAPRVPTHELIIADNGVGLPSGFDTANQKSLGLQLVTILVKQLGGSLAIESAKGTSIRVQFNSDEKNNK